MAKQVRLSICKLDIKIQECRNTLSNYNELYRKAKYGSQDKASYLKTIHIFEGRLFVYKEIKEMLQSAGRDN